MNKNIHFYPSVSDFRRDKSTLLFTLAESDYLGFRHLCSLEMPALSLILFSGQQAIEKYLKAIILLNDGPINSLNHDLKDILIKAIDISKNNLLKDSQDFCKSVIALFENAENSRYGSYQILVDDMLHHKLDKLVINILRETYLQEYKKLFNKGLYLNYLNIILQNKDIYPLSYSSLTFDNHSLGYQNPSKISAIKSVNYKLRKTIIIFDRSIKSRKELEKIIGIKLSNDEFNNFIVGPEEEIINS